MCIWAGDIFMGSSHETPYSKIGFSSLLRFIRSDFTSARNDDKDQIAISDPSRITIPISLFITTKKKRLNQKRQ